MNELSRLGRRLEREIMARVEAEHLLEEKSRELFHANAALSRHAAELDQEVGLKAQELLVAQRVARIGTLIHDLREDAWRVSDGLHLLLDHDPLVQTLDVGRLIDAVHPDDRDLALGIVRPALQDTAVEGERMELVRCVLANGDLIWVELRSELVLAPDGAPHQLVCTVQNITDKKHNELAILESRMQISMRVAELERARAELEMARDDAERASRIKDRFLAIMSHEIRTPLNGVFGALQLLAEDEPDSARREMLSLALHSAEDLRRVTNDVIDMSRLALDQIRIESERFELAALCQDVSDFWRPVAGAKGLQLHCQIAPGLSSGVSGDSGRIRQIINNLVSNAIKFSDEGAVTLRLTSTATAELDRARFRIEVEDQGIGMTEAKLARVLSNVEEEDIKLPERGGAGLGLTICQALIRRMDGSFGMHSRLAQGSRVWFELTLPCFDAQRVPMPPPPERLAKVLNASGKAPKVLFVDDTVPNQVIGQSMLRRLGCLVDLAANGWEAVNAVTAKHYDVVLMDVSMPVMDGVEATQTIRALGGDKASVPIIGQTAFAMPEKVASFLAAGMDDVIHKPLKLDALHGALVDQLDRTLTAEPQRTDMVRSQPREDQDNEQLDKEVLIEMCGSIPAEMLDQLFEHVYTDLAKHAGAAEQECHDDDLIALARAAHALKGLSAGFGCARLEQVARDLEQAAKGGDAPRAYALEKRLGNLAISADRALRHYRTTIVETQHA